MKVETVTTIGALCLGATCDIALSADQQYIGTGIMGVALGFLLCPKHITTRIKIASIIAAVVISWVSLAPGGEIAYKILDDWAKFEGDYQINIKAAISFLLCGFITSNRWKDISEAYHKWRKRR